MAERFAEHGANVMLVGRKQEKLDAAAATIRERGGTAATYATDVRDYPGVQAAVESAANQFGGIDILVCGAAGNFPAPVLGMSANGFKAVIDIDLIGTFNTCRASYEHLNKPGASVIAISASFAFQPTAMQAHVGAGKAGVDILIKTLAIEWGPSGVRCNCITPGPTDDTEGMRRLAPDEAARKRVEKGVPLRRFGTKDELADLVLFLCSDAAKYITGGIYLCDGGMSLSRPSSWLESQ
jgi:NAD(P)-dependent dehydrogenase (short-subunit alcohol dehydrogenase family)